MMKLFLCMSAAAIALTACAPKQDLSQKAEATANGSRPAEFTLPYEKFTLENGLDVILHVDRSDPIVAVTTVIHAGSNREQPGRTGFAHFFEHMAFNDSENVPRGWNRKAIPEWGGTRNGGTWSDGTIYYEVVPKDAFDKILWIDSDRLGYMINTVTQEALDREKQVVKNEKRQRVDNAAYGYTGEVIRAALYPAGHPYSWTVIGSLPDLQAATLPDLKGFHSEYYGPNNVTLSVVGDIDIEDTKRKVQNWFGEIPRGQDITPLPPMPVRLDTDKKLYFEDSFATLPELRLTFPTVEDYHDDSAALRVLGQIIAGSKNSVLFKNIVEADKLAPNVSAYNNAMEIAGEFVVRVRGNAGVDLDDVHASIQNALAEFEDGGVSPQDLQRIKAEQETQLYNNIATVLGKGRELAQANEFAGDPAHITVQAKAIQALTVRDIMAAYNRYIKNKPAIITSFVPKGQTDLAVSGSARATVWIEEVKTGAASENVSAGALADFEKTPTVFDRSEPPFGDLPLLTTPDIWTATTRDNLDILGIENTEIPLVSFDITFPIGALSETADTSGRLNLLSRLMNEGTANKTAAELEQAIGLLGSYISVSSGKDVTRISATSLSRNFEPTVALIREIMTAPRFNQADFDRAQSAALTRLKGQEANPNAIAARVFNQLIYTTEHPMGRPTAGTQDTVSAFTLDDMRAAHQGMLSTLPRIHIAGDITPARAAAAFSGIASDFTTDAPAAITPDIPAQDNAGKVFFVDMPDSKQSVIMIGRLTIAATHADASRLDFTNEKLGGGISGDLSQVLRIEKGYTYGAYSWISSGTQPQPFQIRTSVRANATAASLDVIRDMLRDYGPSFTDEDRDMVQGKLVKEKTRAFESLGAKLGTLRTMSQFNKPANYIEIEQAVLLNMSTSDFQNTAAQYLNEDGMTYLIIGDKTTQFSAVADFAAKTGKGLVTQLTITGEIIKN